MLRWKLLIALYLLQYPAFWLPCGSLSTARAQSFSALVQSFQNPVGIAVGASGDVFVANGMSDSVSKYSADGNKITTFASGFKSPQALAIDSAGNVYVANAAGQTVDKVSSTGTTKTTYATGFLRPQALAFDAHGVLFVADEMTGIVSKVVNGAPSPFARGFSMPTALAFDSSGVLYVADGNRGTVTKVASNGAKSPFVINLWEPTGLALDKQGNLYIADSVATQIMKVTPRGVKSVLASLSVNNVAGLTMGADGLLTGGMTGQQQGSAVPGFSLTQIALDGTISRYAPVIVKPGALVRDSAGDIFVASQGNNAIYEVAPSGAISQYATGFTKIQGLALDAIGTLFAADSATNSLYEVGAGGKSTVFAKGLSNPQAVVYDATGGNFYLTGSVAGTNPYGVIQKVTRSGAHSNFTVIPSVSVGLAFDNTRRLLTLIYDSSNFSYDIRRYNLDGTYTDTPVDSDFYPTAIVSDTAGNVYIANANIPYTPEFIVVSPSNQQTTISTPATPNGLAMAPLGDIILSASDDSIQLMNPKGKPSATQVATNFADQQDYYILPGGGRDFGKANCLPSKLYSTPTTMLDFETLCATDSLGLSNISFRADVGFDSGGALPPAGCSPASPTGGGGVFASRDGPSEIQAELLIAHVQSPPIPAPNLGTHTNLNASVAINLALSSYAYPPQAFSAGGAVGGTVTGFPNDTITFTPKTGFSGLGSFNYTLENGTCSSSVGAVYVGVNLPPPTVASVSPKVGPATGGTTVTIAGSHLTNGSAPLAISFGGDPATIVSSSPTAIVVKTPVHAAGTVVVQVDTLGLVNPAQNSAFTYQ